MRNLLIISLLLLISSVKAIALTPEIILDNQQQEQIARNIFSSLRCMVCDGEAISDSNADLAIDMRRQVRQMLADGQEQQEIIDFFHDRYGDQILMATTFKPHTLPIWIAPIILLIIGGFVIVMHLRRRNA